MTEVERLFEIVHGVTSETELDTFKAQYEQCDGSPNDMVLRGSSLLKVAITNNKLAIIRFLVDQGAELNRWEGDVGRSSPLGFACKLGTIGTVKLLLSLGAEVNLPPDASASPPIRQAAASKNKLGVLRLLISHGADVELCSRDMEGEPSGNALKIACAMGNLEGVKLLLENHAATNVVFPSGTPLAQAVEEGYLEIVKVLLAHGADPGLVAAENPGFPLANKTALEIAQLKRRKAIATLISERAGQTFKPEAKDQISIVELLAKARVPKNPGATRASLAALEADLGTLPSPLLDLLAITDGEPEESDGLFPHPSGDELDGRFHLMSIDQLRDSISNKLGAVPFSHNGLGDYLCFSKTQANKDYSVSIFEHEVGELRLVADSLKEWMIEALQDLA